MPGPAPNPNARRRNDQGAWRTLPATCGKPAPRWPMPGRKPAGLVELWRHLWTLPVADVWHEQNAVRLVARYARLTLLLDAALDGSEDVGATVLAGLPGELRQIEDRLLLSPSARLRARLLVDEPGESQSKNRKTSGKVTRLDEYRDIDVG